MARRFLASISSSLLSGSLQLDLTERVSRLPVGGVASWTEKWKGTKYLIILKNEAGGGVRLAVVALNGGVEVVTQVL